MIKSIFLVRERQLLQQLKGLNVLHYLLLLALLALGVAFLVRHLVSSTVAWLVAAGTLACLVVVHTQRRDRRFLRILSDTPWYIYMVEYSVLCVPVVLLLGLTGHVLPIVLVVTGAMVIASVVPEFSLNSSAWSVYGLVPDALFEWIGGFRQQKTTLLALYAVALGVSSFPYASLVLSMLLVASITTFYTQGESRLLLSVREECPHAFLKHKLISHLCFYYGFLGPVWLVYGVQHLSTWYVTLLFALLSGIVVVFSILLKYAVYRPDEDLSGSTALNSLAIASLFIPFLLPVPAVMCLRHYRKAIKNLTLYLDDYR